MRPGSESRRHELPSLQPAKHVEETIRPSRGPNGEDGAIERLLYLCDFRTGALLLFAAVALLLLIACVNVANLLLARAAARKKETAIWRVLGVSGKRLLQQWMTEAAILVAAGGAIGLVVSYCGVVLLETLSPRALPQATNVGVDMRVLLFTFLISGLVCVLLSLAPALATFQGNVSLRRPRRTRRARC